MVTLTKKINGTTRSKLKTHTPINHAIPREQALHLKRIPRECLQRFKNKTPSGTDWYNLTFRIRICLDLARLYYVEDTIKEVQEVYDTCIAIKDNFKVTKLWQATEEQIAMLENGLDAMDQMQDENTRRNMLEPFKRSKIYVDKLVIQTEKELEGMLEISDQPL